MKDYGSEYPILRRLPSRATLACIVVIALLIFIGQSLFLLTLAGVASGPAAHPAPAHLAHLLSSPSPSLPTEPLAPPNGMARVLLAEVER
jgi:hypothetical protein